MTSAEIVKIVSSFLDFQLGLKHYPEWCDFPKKGKKRITAWAEWYVQKNPRLVLPVEKRVEKRIKEREALGGIVSGIVIAELERILNPKK